MHPTTAELLPAIRTFVREELIPLEARLGSSGHDFAPNPN
jgi:hypothetical protein